MGFIDLHIHTTASDGTFTPTEVVNDAIRRGLSVIAITDHDTTQGVLEAFRALDDYYKRNRCEHMPKDGCVGTASDSSIERQEEAGIVSDKDELIIIPGVEISCWYGGREVHMLGFFVDYTDEVFNARLKAMEEERDRRNDKMIALFHEQGIPMTLEALRFGDDNTIVSRAHFARYLQEHGYVKSREEAFKKYIGDGCPFYLTRNYIDAKQAVDWIHEAGGLAFLAHPYLYGFKEEQVRKMLLDLKKQGLDGLEAYHSAIDNGRTNQLRDYAKQFELLVSGGSDFHGENKPYIYMGVGKGNLRITRHVYDKIVNRQV